MLGHFSVIDQFFVNNWKNSIQFCQNVWKGSIVNTGTMIFNTITVQTTEMSQQKKYLSLEFIIGEV